VYSRSPAERRRSALAGKTKRLVLHLLGDARNGPGLEVEWGSGTVWLGGMRVASAASAAPPHADAVATGGWIDISGIAQKLRFTRERVKADWEPLAAQLRLGGRGELKCMTWNLEESEAGDLVKSAQPKKN
jgi:hypothetical protein